MPLGSSSGLLGVGSAISGIGSLFGAGKSSSAALQAAQVQAQAAEYAANLQMQMFQSTSAGLSPYNFAGQFGSGLLLSGLLAGQGVSAPSILSQIPGFSNLTPQNVASTAAALTGPGTSGGVGGAGAGAGNVANLDLYNMLAGASIPVQPLGVMPTTWGMQNQFTPTMASLAQTPGYQFTLGQGLQATTNQMAAQGLGGSVTGGQGTVSGPLAAGLTQYATGLASNTFNQQYQNWLSGQNLQMQQQQQLYNMLSGQIGTGENAAAMTGNQGVAAAQAAGNYLTSGAAAQAAGIVGSANALNAGISGAGSSLQNFALINALGGGGLFGAGTTSALTGTQQIPSSIGYSA